VLQGVVPCRLTVKCSGVRHHDTELLLLLLLPSVLVLPMLLPLLLVARNRRIARGP
jgi:hypothetical protein